MDPRLMRSELLPMLSDRALELIILPTEQCNFRCTYCYEDFSIGRMMKKTVVGIRHLMQRRAPDLTGLQLSWFGGEPLLARSIVYELCDLAQQLALSNPTMSYTSSMTTN